MLLNSENRNALSCFYFDKLENPVMGKAAYIQKYTLKKRIPYYQDTFPLILQ